MSESIDRVIECQGRIATSGWVLQIVGINSRFDSLRGEGGTWGGGGGRGVAATRLVYHYQRLMHTILREPK